MRIRKRSVGVKSSSSCLEPEGRKFLLPLVAAAMNGQTEVEAEAELTENAALAPKHCHGIRKLPAHNWKNVLLRFNTKNEAEKAGGEGHNPNYKWNGIMRNERNKSILLAGGDRVKKETSRSLDQQISGSEREVSKSDGIQKLFVSVGDLTVKKKRSKKYHAIGCDDVQYYNAGRKEDDINLNTNQAVRKPKTSDDINHGGSQCKRRNGRGWRCSQRTLVGYSLCEHHLGKSRFKNINSSNSAVTVSVNNKGVGSKYKELHLINATHM